MPIPYDRSLNPAQAEAVKYTGGPLLVLAGAGSGKTRVITYKIAHLIEECGYHPGSIIAVTFTNKASIEMMERVGQLLGERAEIWVKTFHATAARLLRVLGRDLGVDPGFSIMDQQDQNSQVKRVLREMNLDPDTWEPKRYVSLINRAKDRLVNAEEAGNMDLTEDPWFAAVYEKYTESLNRSNLLDFADLILRLVKGLQRNPEVLSRLRARFRYILVDEFQDTNHAQYELLKLLAPPGSSASGRANLCVVGDDDQSIYAFRGARVENLTEFTQEYPDVRIIRLEQNYRSCQSILTASSRLISNNLGRLGKELFTTRGKGEILRFLQTPTDYDEARYIAYEVRNQVNKGRRPCDIAVFYRMNAQSRVLEAVFTQERIPYKVVGGFRFYEREEVKDILAYLRLMMNPMDEVSLRRVANKPPRKVGEKTVDALVAATIRRGVPFFRLEELELPSSRKAAVQQFTGLLRELSEKQEDPLLLLRQLYDRSGYLEWLGSERGTERVENLQELYNALEEYLKRNPAGALADFLEEVSLNQGAGDEEFADGQVFFITLHNAKGLEFPVVFMAGMEEGIFPHFRSEGQIEDIQEERRLCYVGMTRAMEQLYLTAARERKLYGRRVEREVSCFVHEIPEELLEYREAGIPGMPAGARRFRGPGESGRFPSRPGAVAGRGASEGPVPAFPRERRRGESRSKSGENRSAGSRPAGSRPAGGRLAGNQQGPVLNQRLSDRDIERIGPGARIRHKQFGPGSVLSVSKGVADIEFADGKRMRFMLKYTPITLDREGGGSQG